VVGSKVLLELLVVEIVLWVPSTVSSVTDVTSLVLFATVRVKLVISVESFLAETTFWMSSEPGLVHCAGLVITFSFVSSKLSKGEHLMLVSKDLLMADAQITHELAMLASDVFREMRPGLARHLACLIGAIVPQQEDRVLHDRLLLKFDSKILVYLDEVAISKVLEWLLGIVREDCEWCLCAAMRACSRLVEGSHAKSTDMTGLMIAGVDSSVLDRAGADEAHFCII
jgi:hypothetical protein